VTPRSPPSASLIAHVVQPSVRPPVSTPPTRPNDDDDDENEKKAKNISTHRQALVPEPGDEERFLRRRERLQPFQVAILLLLGGCVDDLQRPAGRRRRALLVRASADGFRRERVSLRERVHRVAGACVFARRRVSPCASGAAPPFRRRRSRHPGLVYACFIL